MNEPILQIKSNGADASAPSIHSVFPAVDLFKEIADLGWLPKLAKYLSGVYQISPTGSVILPVCAVAATAGGNYTLDGIQGLLWMAPFNNLFIGTKGTMFRAAGDFVFSITRTASHGEVIERPDREHIMQAIEEARIQLAGYHAKIEAMEKLQMSPEYYDSNREESESLDVLRLKRSAIVGQLKELIDRYGQVIITDGFPIEILRKPAALSFDRVMHVMSNDASIIPGLLAASPRMQSEIGHLAAQMLSPVFVASGMGALHKGALSFSIMANYQQSLSILNSKSLWNSGFLDQFLLTDMKFDPLFTPASETSEGGWDGFRSVIDRLIKKRNGLDRREHQLSKTAKGILWDYICSRQQAAEELAGECPNIFEHVSAIVQKLALTLHLIRGLFNELEVDDKTATAACALCDVILSGHLAVLGDLKQSGREQQCDKFDRDRTYEVIIERIRVRGPLSRREIARSFAKQKSEYWEPALAKAMEVGAIVKSPDGTYMLPDRVDDRENE